MQFPADNPQAKAALSFGDITGGCRARVVPGWSQGGYQDVARYSVLVTARYVSELSALARWEKLE
jgi:hypothetical protein